MKSAIFAFFPSLVDAVQMKTYPNTLCVMSSTLCDDWLTAGKVCTAVWSDECPGIDHRSGRNDITLAEGCPDKCAKVSASSEQEGEIMDLHEAKEYPSLCAIRALSCDDWIAAGKSCSAVWSDECPGIDHQSGNNDITLAAGCPGKCAEAAAVTAALSTTLAPSTEQENEAMNTEAATEEPTMDAEVRNLRQESGAELGFCANNCLFSKDASWDEKCGWPSCKGCGKCQKETPDALQESCPSKCMYTNGKSWDDKCKWSICKGCNECLSQLGTVKIGCHSKCVYTQDKTWEEKCSWGFCTGCAECGSALSQVPSHAIPVENEETAATLNEAGYQAVASRKSNAKMNEFIRQVILAHGGKVTDKDALHGIVPKYSGNPEKASYKHLLKDLKHADWIEKADWTDVATNAVKKEEAQEEQKQDKEDSVKKDAQQKNKKKEGANKKKHDNHEDDQPEDKPDKKGPLSWLR